VSREGIGARHASGAGTNDEDAFLLAFGGHCDGERGSGERDKASGICRLIKITAAQELNECTSGECGEQGSA
jgi:hypothetical protein